MDLASLRGIPAINRVREHGVRTRRCESLELVVRDDAEASTARTPDRPEEIGILRCGGCYYSRVGQDDSCFYQVVTCEAFCVRGVAVATTDNVPAHAYTVVYQLLL